MKGVYIYLGDRALPLKYIRFPGASVTATILVWATGGIRGGQGDPIETVHCPIVDVGVNSPKRAQINILIYWKW